MGCGASASKKEPLALRAGVTLDGLNDDQREIVERLWQEDGQGEFPMQASSSMTLDTTDPIPDGFGARSPTASDVEDLDSREASLAKESSQHLTSPRPAQNLLSCTLDSDVTARASLMSTVDFDLEGARILDNISPLVGKKNFNVIWTHPKSGAKLFVGSEVVAFSRETLIENGITRLVVCYDQDTAGPFDGEAEFNYLYFPIGQWKSAKTSVTSSEGVARICAPAIGFVEEELSNGNSVLVHCLAGCHRAGTTGIMCLLYFCGMDCRMAICAAQAARPSIEALSHLKIILRRASRAHQGGVLKKAVEAAKGKGYQQAAIDVFGRCGPLDKRQTTLTKRADVA